MKKTVLIILVIHCSLLTLHLSAQPCLPNGITFSTQAQIDNFQSLYPNCTEIVGDVFINGDNITNLDGLNVLTAIGGYLWLEANYALTDLSGLEAVTSIGGSLSIQYNIALSNLTSLDNLTSIGEGLSIFHNHTLTSLTGLQGLTFIPGGLFISYNYTLTNLTGLDNVTSIGGYLWIDYNDALTSLTGLNNVTSIEGNLSIYDNNLLYSLTGFDNLTSIEGNLWIDNNNALTSLTGLNNVTSIGEGIVISQNNAVTSLAGLDNVTSIGGGLVIVKNAALTSLTGLDNVSSIGGGLTVWGNHTLIGLTGLENIDAGSISNLRIYENISLSTCEVQCVCDYLASPNGEIGIYDNAPGCNSPEEVTEACLHISVPEIRAEVDFSIFPNPIGSVAKIEYTLKQSSAVQLAIYDFVGNKVEVIEQKQSQGKQQIIWNAMGLPEGIYFCVVKTNEGIQTIKMIKL